MVKGSGVTPKDSPMIQVPSEQKGPDGRRVSPRRIASGAEAPDAVALLRRVLAARKVRLLSFVASGLEIGASRPFPAVAHASALILLASQAPLLR